MGEGFFQLGIIGALLAARHGGAPVHMIHPRFRAHQPSPWQKKHKSRCGAYTEASGDKRSQRKAERQARGRSR